VLSCSERAPEEAEALEERPDEPIPSWASVVRLIRAAARARDGQAAEELQDWADFVEGCAQLRRD
jgi:hypothetical protein